MYTILPLFITILIFQPNNLHTFQNGNNYTPCECVHSEALPLVAQSSEQVPFTSGGHFTKYWGGGGGGEIFNMYTKGVSVSV